jgi:streptogramin lyase/mono/diheme cytochrome c family protein
MKRMTNRPGVRISTAAALTLAIVLIAVASRGQIQMTPPTRGQLSGTVTADQGAVLGFRVTVHNLTYKLWYTVFTVKGHYTVPQALPGSYDVLVLEKGYTSPTLRIDLTPGEEKTADIAVKKIGERPAGAQGASTEGMNVAAFGPRIAANTVWVNSMDELYPPGPGRDLLKANCTGCHGPEFGTMHRTKEGYRVGIARMTETGPTDNPFGTNLGHTYLTGAQKDQIAEYLATNFGPAKPDKRLKVDPPIINEDALAKTIYVSYDIPDNFPRPPFRGDRIGADEIDGVTAQELSAQSGRALPQLLHDPFIVPDGIWYANPTANAMIHLDPKQLDPSKRFKVYPLKGPDPYVFMHGITVDSKGHVFWAEITGGQLGELDPETGKQIRHYTPRRGGMLQVATDKDDNIWFGMVKGPGGVGELVAKTGVVHQWQTPTPDNLIYGLAISPTDGTVWGAGYSKGQVTEFNPKTEEYTEYYAPGSWGQIRRVGVDSKGIVWFSEYNTGILGRLDPATGKMTEYKMPTLGANPYDPWPDKTDKIWISDQPQSSLVHFDPDTKKFTYYPEPQLNWSLPKVEVEKNNTVWFGARFLPYITANHLYPNGYSADAPPEP